MPPGNLGANLVREGMLRFWQGTSRPSAKKRTKIVLVSAYSMGYASGKFVTTAPRGLWHLHAYLDRVKKIPTAVVDSNMSSLAEIINAVREVKPLLIGSSPLHATLLNDFELMRKLKKASPDSLFVVGGIEMTTAWREILPWFPADLAVLGPGEKSLAAVFHRLSKNWGDFRRSLFEIFGNIPGLVIKMPNGELKFTGNPRSLSSKEFRQIVRNLAFSKIPYEEYWKYEESFGDEFQTRSRNIIKTIRISSSDGCEHYCAFCVNTALHKAGLKTINKLSPEDVIHVLEKAAKAHPQVEAFMLDDETLLEAKGQERIIELCRLIYKKGLNRFKFVCRGRVDFVKSPLAIKTLRAMELANFVLISYGVETASQEMLEALNKKIRIEEADRAIRITHQAGLVPKINIILFLPFEDFTTDELCQTVEKCLDWYEWGNVEIGITLFIDPYPGTPLIERKDLKFRAEAIKFKIGNEKIAYLHRDVALPSNEEMHQLAEQAIRDKNEKWLAYFGERYFPEKGPDQIPKFLHNLALFYAIYKILGKDTSRIEKLAKKLTEKDPYLYFDRDRWAKDRFRRRTPGLKSLSALRQEAGDDLLLHQMAKHAPGFIDFDEYIEEPL